MDYELCKKLKDAGFPQNPASFIYVNGLGIHYNVNNATVTVENPEIVRAPTLSELIDACDKHSNKKGWITLSHNRGLIEGGWYAEDSYFDGDMSYIEVDGASPKEAVANLWLELQHNS